MTYASKLKVDRGIPGEPILYLSGKISHVVNSNQFSYILAVSGSTFKAYNIFKYVVLIPKHCIGRRKFRLRYCLAILQRGFLFCIFSPMKYSSHTSHDLDYFKPGKRSDGWFTQF